jgi:hypothetical protein
MLNKSDVVWWNEIEHDLYEENGCIFGVVFDLFNNRQSYYWKTVRNGQEVYRPLGDNIYKAIELFNAQ